MTTHAEMRKALLDGLGNPVSGAIVQNIDEIVRIALETLKPGATQTRVQEPAEKR